MKHSIKIEQLEELVPISLIRDPKRYRRFLDAFLIDFENDKLFEPRKVQILSCLLLGAMRNEDVSNFFDTDDLLVCLQGLKNKLKNLSVDEDNRNLQAGLDSLSTVVYLMGII